MFIDAHAHLDSRYFEEPVDEILDRAMSAGVGQLIVVGCGVASSENAVRLASQHPGRLFASVGVHPHDAAGVSVRDFDTIARLAERPEVVAVGETGLDYYYDHSPREVQREVFGRFLRLAHAVGKPVVIHTREAEADTLEILHAHAPLTASGQLHCFTGTMELAEAALELGMYVSFSGALTFANADRLRDCARALPLEKLLVETDCPYMTPAPFRGRSNEPMLVPVVAGTLARVKELSVVEVAESTSRATRALFRLPTPESTAVRAFAAGVDLFMAVHDAGLPLHGLQAAARNLPLRKIARVVPFLPQGTQIHPPALDAVRSFAAEIGKPVADPASTQ